MIDEMMLVFDSPGSASKVFITVLLSRDPTNARGTDTSHKQRKCAARVYYALGRSELVGCGVRLGRQLSAASLQDENARAMPMSNNDKNHERSCSCVRAYVDVTTIALHSAWMPGCGRNLSVERRTPEKDALQRHVNPIRGDS